MKVAFFILIAFVGSSAAFAQRKFLSANQIQEHISKCIRKNYHPDTPSLTSTCREACIFIKFKVNANGKISGLAFSKDTSQFIIKALRTAVDSLNRDAALMKTLKHSGKVVIQPFTYIYFCGCKFPKADFSTIKGEEARKYLRDFLKVALTRDKFDETFWGMLNFNGKDLKVLDCLLLNPIGDWFTEKPY
ncbi:MAG: hypothetical protein M3O71_31230 [Bacteroidota bacterium]|nr:hypothetical protein [Bacteroidota bacterium]